MKQMTAIEYGNYGHDISYLLPFSPLNQSENEMLEKLKDLFSENKCYLVEKSKIEIDNKYNTVTIAYLYAGHGEYHLFELEFEIIYLTDIDRHIISGQILQAVHDLFEVIIRNPILPEWTKVYGLKEYNYFHFYPYKNE